MQIVTASFPVVFRNIKPVHSLSHSTAVERCPYAMLPSIALAWANYSTSSRILLCSSRPSVHPQTLLVGVRLRAASVL